MGTELSQLNTAFSNPFLNNFVNNRPASNPVISKNIPVKDTFVLSKNPDKAEKTEQQNDSYKTMFYVATAVAGAAVALLPLVYLKNKSRPSVFIENECNFLKEKVAQLTENNIELKETSEFANKEKNKLQALLMDIPDDVIASSGDTAKNELKEARKLILKPLNYDPLNPPLEEIISKQKYNIKFFDFNPQSSVSTIRTHLPDFKPPTLQEVHSSGLVEFIIPIEKIGNIKPNISPDANKISCDPKFIGEFRDTDIEINYGRFVKWSEDKVARDLMQNFYDGHGHTLEGVKVRVQYDSSAKKYKIKVSGEGEYNHRSIEVFGASNKNENPKNAGGFGEGAKVMAVKMLKDFDVPEIKFASVGWEVAYKDGKNGFLNRQVKHAENSIKGNYVEFETENKELAEAVLRSTNYFYHPQNPDFKALTFENEHFGFRLLGPDPNNDRGNVYLTQRFEYGESEGWENQAENVTIIFKIKPDEKRVFDSNRDRIKIGPPEIENLSAHFAKTMTDKEIADAISALEPVWSHDRLKIYDNIDKVEDLASVRLLNGFLNEANMRSIELKFKPDQKHLALPKYKEVSKEILEELKNKGYIICPSKFKEIGMKDIDIFLKEKRNHGAILPTKNEVIKLNIINEAATVITQSMRGLSETKKVVAPKDSVQPTYIFEKEDGDNTLAEAITKFNVNKKPHYKDYIGHWIARDYLNGGTFSEILATKLHEACHQYGGDESSIFSYKLTDVIEDYNSVIINDPLLRLRLAAFNKLWNEIPKT